MRSTWRGFLFLFLWFLEFRLSGSWVGDPLTWRAGWMRVLAAYFVLDVALLLTILLLLRLLDGRRFVALGLGFHSGWGKELLLGTALGAGLMTVFVGTMAGTRALRYLGGAANGEGTAAWTLELAVVLFLAAVAEELGFRGYGFQRLVDSVGPLWATLGFAAMFGAVHLANPSATAVSTANTALVGVLLAVAYLKTRGLWMPIGLHWAWNLFQGEVFSLPVSGISFPPTLLRPEVSGPAWLTGGRYGPEGSAAVTVLCAAAIVWLWRTPRISVSPEMQEVLE